MSVYQLIILFVGFLFGVSYICFLDLICEMFRYFHHKNIEYRERKQDKKTKKEEVEK